MERKPYKPARETGLIAELRTLHQEIKAHRSGKPIDVFAHLSQVREEREHELIGEDVNP